MATPRTRQTARVRARQRRAQQRARRLAVLVVVGIAAAVALLVTAFGSGASTTATTTAAVPATGSARPGQELLAVVGNLQIQLPIAGSSVTAIGYHGANDGALSLQPVGRQGNEGLFARLWRRIAGAGRRHPVWYQLDGRNGTEVLDVGAPVGADVYAPVAGSVVAISDVVMDGRTVGSRIDLRPSAAPSTTVSLVNLRPDPSLAVGTPVLAAVSKLGTVVDIASFEDQALAAHSGDEGNNVAISVYPSTSLLP